MDRQNHIGFTYKSPINLLYLFTETMFLSLYYLVRYLKKVEIFIEYLKKNENCMPVIEM